MFERSTRVTLFVLLAGCLAGALTMSDADLAIEGPDELRFGYVVKTVGDVSGDGRDDYVVTAPNPASSKVYVYFGPIGTGSLTEADADAVFTGPANSEAGWAVDGGDVSGDGRADLVIGAPSATSAKGVIYVMRNPIAAGNYTSANAWATLTGASANDILGTSLAVGDYTGDGTKDLAIGAPWANVGANADAGKVYLVRGPLAAGSRSITTAATYTFNGAAAGALTGWSLDFAGSMDASGGDELVIGAPRITADGLGACGSAYIVWSGLAAGSHNLENAALDIAFIRGDRQAGELGWSVAGGGDVTNDGFDDVLLGAPAQYCALNNFGCASDHGSVHLIEGAARIAGHPVLDGESFVEDVESLWINGTTQWGGLGTWLAIVGDTDADGYDEMLVGTLANKAYLFYGGDWNGHNLVETQAHATLSGDDADDAAGVGVGAAGDANSDGYADLFVGAPGQVFYEDGPQPVTGKAYLFHGSM